MSSDPQSDAPSPPAGSDIGEHEASVAATVAATGAPLLEGLEAHVPGSLDHAEATAAYAFAAAVELSFDRGRAEAVREAARLHEVGNVYLPVALLRKRPDELDADERELSDARFEAGHKLAIGAGVPERVAEWLLRAGERWDGGGPESLRGEAIPIESRIVRAGCVCASALAAAGQAEDALARARDALRDAAGDELDPGVADALIAVLARAAS